VPAAAISSASATSVRASPQSGSVHSKIVSPFVAHGGHGIQHAVGAKTGPGAVDESAAQAFDEAAEVLDEAAEVLDEAAEVLDEAAGVR
jgi:hypothetical protein